nr:hypothetical protein [Pelagibacterales bacterium]
QQASGVGRLLLAFANTPMQYNRMIKRAGQDLYYGRGDWRSNISKIVYYSTLQNFIFNALQKAVYVIGFGLYDDGDADIEKQKEKTTSVFEGMLDSLLSGFGIQGKIAISAKAFGKDFLNTGKTLYTMPNGEKGELSTSEFAAQYESLSEQGVKFDFSQTVGQAFYDSDWKNLLELSPPFGSKIKKGMSADYLKRTYKNSKQWEEMSIRNPQLMWYAKYTEAIFNLPVDRMLRKAHNLQSVMADETADWQKLALVLGWNEWDLGIEGMDLHSEFGKKAKETDEFLKVKEYKKEYHEKELDEIESRGYKRVPMTGKNSFIPEGKPGVDYIRIKHWDPIKGWRYLVPKEVWDKRFPPPPPPTVEGIIEKSRQRIKKKYGITI